MRPAISRLVEAVRALRLSVSQDVEGRKLAIGVPKSSLTDHLIDIHDALAEFDADGAPEVVDARRMREALNEVFRWIKVQGLSIDEPAHLVADILGIEGKKKSNASYEILPSFAPKHVRKRKTWKPALTLPLDRMKTMRSISDHKKNAAVMEQVVDRMGVIIPGSR